MAAGSVLILTGPPGSGKSTVAQLVAERSERSVHVESDVFFRWIVGGYVEPWLPASHEQNIAVMTIVGDVAASYARAGYFTIVDGIIMPGWSLEPLTSRLRADGSAVATVILRPPLAVCIERAASRSSDRLADARVVEQLWDGFGELGDLDAYVLDNAAEPAEVTADRVLGPLSSQGGG